MEKRNGWGRWASAIASLGTFFVSPADLMVLKTDAVNVFELYRKTVDKEFGIDLKDYADKRKSGEVAGKWIAKYDLAQIISGTRLELERTQDKTLALESAMDHLGTTPDYYSRLASMAKTGKAAMAR